VVTGAQYYLAHIGQPAVRLAAVQRH
jgi:hypothetical protein